MPTQIEVEVEKVDAVMFKVQFQCNSLNPRQYSINLEILDSQHEAHPNPRAWLIAIKQNIKMIKTFLSVKKKYYRWWGFEWLKWGQIIKYSI